MILLVLATTIPTLTLTTLLAATTIALEATDTIINP